MRYLFIFLLVFLTAACANIKTREQIEAERQRQVEDVDPTPDEAKKDGVISEELPQLPPQMARPELKVGIVFGPSGLLAPAQIGVLQELTRTRLPIHAVSGMEMGALVAALYASDGRSNDAEWKYFKLREEDLISKSFLRGNLQPRSTSELRPYLEENFGRNQLQDAAIQFRCPSFEVSRARSKILSSGLFAEMLPYCMAFPPIWQPVQGHLADTLNYSGVADSLRAAGANYVILVHALPNQAGRAESKAMGEWVSAMWAMVIGESKHSPKGFDHVIHIDVGNRGIVDFESRRDLLRMGRDQGRRAAAELVKIHGL